MIRVGIDARPLSEPVTGIGRHTVELTSELIKEAGEFFLYSAADFSNDIWQKNNITGRSSGYHSRASKMIWSQTKLPYWAAKDQLDIFWGPTHRLPQFLPTNVARVVTIHDLVWRHAGKTMRRLSRSVEKILMPKAIFLADRIVASSISTAEAIKVEYPEVARRVRVVYPGVSNFPTPQPFEALSELGIFGSYFLFVGTLEPRKNLRRLLQAFASLDTSTKDRATLVIAGDRGWGNVDVKRWINELALDGRVIVPGYVSDELLSTLYSHAQFLVMPSLYEGFGLPLVEAMSFGKPVLTSNRSSLPEVAGNAGILVDPFDHRSIAKGLFTLLCNNVEREKLASMAIPTAQQFTWQNAARDMWAVFEEAIAERAEQHRSRK